MRDLAGHQELQGIFGSGIPAEIDQPLIDDLSSRFGGNVASEVDVEFACNFEIISSPSVALRIKEAHPSAARDRDQGVGFGCFANRFERFEMHARQGADDLEMAKLLSANVHKEIFSSR